MGLNIRTDYNSFVSKYKVEIFDEEKDYMTVARGFIIIDRKLEGRPAGLIEDIWTHEDFRKQGLGKQVVEALVEVARKKDCYKVVLICGEHNIPFYEKCGFHPHQKGMRFDL